MASPCACCSKEAAMATRAADTVRKRCLRCWSAAVVDGAAGGGRRNSKVARL
jgi:hypothetical protein